ncbi:enoyl-CoA hydratase/isomerase family protein [Homoserinimonas sp. OAct 916]|uniref:enoyl-CoA hydratase/isomerase family protein n=1 Tax=Homoserinimonas sp. OAct 916 TaxID=2211450 RepID=UPI000DBE289E|nr:enoyl-CoA hydratase/isomerase family protein [Homoserinimonas sp. OAct 916]
MSLTVVREGAIVHITLNRPEQGNRLNREMLLELKQSLQDAQGADEPAAVVTLTAAGDDFSLGRERVPGTPQNPKAVTAEFELIQSLNQALTDCSAVTIAGIRGRAEGAGLSLAARCDIVVTADDASLSFPEIPHGIPPTIVLSHYKYVLPRNILGDLIFTGRVLNGPEAVVHGLAARSVSADTVEQTVQSLAQQISGYDHASIHMVKNFLSRSATLSPAEAPNLGIAMYAVEMADRAFPQPG